MEITLIIFILVILVGIYLYYENTSLQVTNYIVVNSKISQAFNNYKIAHISDFHNTKSERLTNKLVKEITNANPNIIVITGDSIDARRTRVDVAFSFVKQLVDITTVYYIPGNHESRIDEYEAFKNSIINVGVKVLENKTVILTEGTESINLLGIKDPAFSYKYSVDDAQIVKNEINNLQYDTDKYTILLSHRPEIFHTYVESNIDLVFTGHAHGGQIRLPLFGGVIAPAQGFFPKYSEGIHKEKNTTMIISRGIGNSLFPFRVNNRPELVVVELKSK